MAAYTADIQIAVKGATQITNLQRQLEATAEAVNKVNRTLGARGLLSNSINNLRTAATQAERAMRSVSAGTSAQKQAIDTYVKSLDAAERAENELTRAIQRRRRELGLAASTTGRAAGGRGGGRFGDIASNAIIGGAFPLLFGQGGGAATGGAIGGAVGGLFGGAGGFAGSLLGTLIGDIASKGAQIKELAKDIGFSAEQTKQLELAFAQAGREADKFQAAVQNIRGLGLSLDDQADAIRLVSSLTETYGGKIDKVANAFTSALESGKVTQATLNQLTSEGIPIQDALARKYGVSRDAILKMAKDGTIQVQTLADVLVDMGNKGELAGKKPKSAFDQFTAAIQNTGTAISNLATRIAKTLAPVLDAILLKATSVLNSINSALAAGQISDQQKQGFKQQAEGIVRGQAGFLPGGPFGAGQIEVNYGGKTYKGQASSVVSEITNDLINSEVRRRTPAAPVPKPGTIGAITAPSQAAPSAGRSAAGRKPPEDRTAQLMEELRATIDIGKAEDRIRDLRFQGRDILAAQAEFDKQIADIQRDKNKSLLQANYETERIVINKIAEARTTKATLELEDQIRDITQQRFEQDMRNKEVIQQTIQPLTDFRREQELQIKYSQNFYRLVKEGILPAEAERIIQFEQLVEQQLYAVEQQIQLTESAILEARARGASTVELEKQLKLLKDQQDAIKGEAAKGPGPAKTDAQRLEEALGNARADLATLTDPINQITRAAEAMGAAFSNAFTGLVSGAMTGQEALASFFKGVGDHFMDMAAQMIAKLIQIWILQTVLGFIGGAAGGSIAPGPVAQANGVTPRAGFMGPAFAEGGLVTRPTMAMVGEGGEPEYIIPASKMRGAMERYSAGARGAGVIPNGRDSGGASGAAGTTVIDVRYNVERINSVDYVTADEFQAGIRQAAAQGAAQGEQRTLRKLQMSPSVRRRVGV